MKSKELPSAEYLNECLFYDGPTGKVFWKHRPLVHFEREYEYVGFSAERECKRWNTRYAGKEAGNIGDEGYLTISFNKDSFKLHRVIWKMVTKTDPPDLLDHKDRNRANNRWRNLRLADDSTNQINRVRSWGASEVAGVRFQRGRWYARINKDRKEIAIGGFDSKQEAIAARHAKARELYGEFAPQ